MAGSTEDRAVITPAYARTLAAYNSAMNRRVYEAAARLSDEARRADKGAFWRSIHGTLNHLLWADHMWMARLDGWPKPDVAVADSDRLVETFEALHSRRARADEGMEAWAARLGEPDLEGDLTWYSGVKKREVSHPRGFIIANMFNHQTHHRGQVHALITAAGEATGDTDLWMLIDGPR
jgi:uncharacterized damage-inducible protein DinB